MQSSLPRPAAPPRKERIKMLVVMRGNGLIEVYADDHVDVHMVNRLDVGDLTAEGATLLDEYHMGTMPRCYRRLYWPKKLRAMGFYEKITPEQALDTLAKKSIVRGLRAMREEAGR